MSQKGVLVALLAGCCAMAAQADTKQSAHLACHRQQEFRWKFRSPTGSATGQFRSTSSPVQTEAINLSNPDFNTTYQLQARTLYASLSEQAGTDFKLALNGQPLPQHHALPLTQATRYFLSYLAPAAKPDQTGETAYELLVYWHG